MANNPILNQVAKADTKPLYTPYGYVITEDGTIYSLLKQHTHGVILACLFPELASINGYGQPDEEYCVYHYQRFELDHYTETTVIRISLSVVTGELNLSKSDDQATPQQLDAVKAIIKVQSLKSNDKVMTELHSMTVGKLIDKLTTGAI